MSNLIKHRLLDIFSRMNINKQDRDNLATIISSNTGSNNGKIEDLLINVTYEELVGLVENSQLVIGAKYRITDYHCDIQSDAPITSNNYYFDIITEAISNNTLNEECKVAYNENNNVFDLDVSKWKVWYTIKNDYYKDGSKVYFKQGVIYRLIDEFNNDINYDFMNIKFAIGNTFEIYSAHAGISTSLYHKNFYTNIYNNKIYLSNPFKDSCKITANYIYNNTINNLDNLVNYVTGKISTRCEAFINNTLIQVTNFEQQITEFNNNILYKINNLTDGSRQGNSYNNLISDIMSTTTTRINLSGSNNAHFYSKDINGTLTLFKDLHYDQNEYSPLFIDDYNYELNKSIFIENIDIANALKCGIFYRATSSDNYKKADVIINSNKTIMSIIVDGVEKFNIKLNDKGIVKIA